MFLRRHFLVRQTSFFFKKSKQRSVIVATRVGKEARKYIGRESTKKFCSKLHVKLGKIEKKGRHTRVVLLVELTTISSCSFSLLRTVPTVLTVTHFVHCLLMSLVRSRIVLFDWKDRSLRVLYRLVLRGHGVGIKPADLMNADDILSSVLVDVRYRFLRRKRNQGGFRQP